MTTPAVNRFTTIEVDMTQRKAYLLRTEPRRIIACVEACMGIATDELERLPAWALMDLLKARA